MTKRGRGRPKTIDRQRTIHNAMNIYWQEGVGALSLNELCRRIGVSKPALYREFHNEDGLMEEALISYRALIITPLLEALESSLPFSELMEQLTIAMTSDQGAHAGCLFTQMRLARTHLGPLTRARLILIEQERRDALESYYQRACLRLEVNASITPELAARYIDTQWSALLVQMRMGEPPTRVQAQTRIALHALHISNTLPEVS